MNEENRKYYSVAPLTSFKKPKLYKDGKFWIYVDPNRVLVSDQKSDKEFMTKLVQEWKSFDNQ